MIKKVPRLNYLKLKLNAMKKIWKFLNSELKPKEVKKMLLERQKCKNTKTQKTL